jgi:hypothetical protein
VPSREMPIPFCSRYRRKSAEITGQKIVRVFGVVRYEYRE